MMGAAWLVPKAVFLARVSCIVRFNPRDCSAAGIFLAG